MHIDFKNQISSETLLLEFEKNFIKIQDSDLSYKISRFFSKDIDLFDYVNKKKNFIFYKDKTWVETHLAVYKANDKKDNSNWIIFELIIWEKKQKDIMFFSEGKVYNIIQNKWGKIIDTHIIEDKENIVNILKFLENEIEYISLKVWKYQNKLRNKWLLSKKTSEEKIQSFKKIFTQSILVS